MRLILVESLMESLPAQGLPRGRSWQETRAGSGFKEECLVGNQGQAGSCRQCCDQSTS